MNILIVSGTNRPNSASLAVATYIQQSYVEHLECKVLSLCDLPHDLLNNNYYSQRHPQMLAMAQMIQAGDVILFVIPEYHGSFPGIVKFFLDLMPSSTFRHKPVGIIGVSDGHAGNMRGIDHFVGVMHYLRARVISLFPKISNVQTMMNGETFVPDDRVINHISGLLEEIQQIHP